MSKPGNIYEWIQVLNAINHEAEHPGTYSYVEMVRLKEQSEVHRKAFNDGLDGNMAREITIDDMPYSL